VKRESPVAVLNAKNAAPSGPSESKSMISRWISSGWARGVATSLFAKVSGGAGVAIGSKPRFRFTQARSALIDPPAVRRRYGSPRRFPHRRSTRRTSTSHANLRVADQGTLECRVLLMRVHVCASLSVAFADVSALAARICAPRTALKTPNGWAPNSWADRPAAGRLPAIWSLKVVHLRFWSQPTFCQSR